MIPFSNRNCIVFVEMEQRIIAHHSIGMDGEMFVQQYETYKKEQDKNMFSATAVLNVTYELDHKATVNGLLGLHYEDNAPNEGRQIGEVFLHGLNQVIITTLEKEKKSNYYRSLFEATRDIYSSNDAEQIIELLYKDLLAIYHDFNFTIWLSQDYEPKVPIKKLDLLQQDKNPNIEAYMTGEAVLCEWNERYSLFAPFLGKQGAYGVLQFESKDSLDRLEREQNAMSVLSASVGVALEKANLYQQSQRLIDELQVINETSHELSQTLDVEENIDFILTKINETFKPDGLHFLTFVPDEQHYVMVGTSEPSLEDQQFIICEHEWMQEVHKVKEPLIIGDTNFNEHLLFRGCCGLDYRSLMLIPFQEKGRGEGIVLVTHLKPNYFTYEDFRLLQTLINHASLALLNSSLHQELNHLVITDYLTKLYSRTFLDQQVVHSQSKDMFGSFILIDVDDFKVINDTYGHQIGDNVLIQIANVMLTSIRGSDIAARWGGEELVIYLPNVKLEQGIEVAERITKRVYEETDPNVSISCGVSFWEQVDELISLERLFKRADLCLYEAKSSGKNRVVSQVI